MPPPTVTDEDRVSREHEMSQWGDFYRHLPTHEAHHEEGVINQLEQTVASWKINGTRPRSVEEANERMQALLSEISLHDQAIDQRFGHQ
jgi:hypothetical protein